MDNPYSKGEKNGINEVFHIEISLDLFIDWN